jgi:hypothetical protein
MKCLYALYLEAIYLKFCVKRQSLLSFGVTLLSKSTLTLGSEKTHPQKPKLINTTNARIRVFLLN